MNEKTTGFNQQENSIYMGKTNPFYEVLPII